MKRILVVEDEPEIQEFLTAYLRHEGYCVTAAVTRATPVSRRKYAAALLWGIGSRRR